MWSRNAAAPVFRGHVSEDGRAIVGIFTIPRVTKCFACMFLFLPLISLLNLVRNTEFHLAGILFLILVPFFAVAMVWMGWNVGKSDIAEITELLQSVGGDQQAPNTPQPPVEKRDG